MKKPVLIVLSILGGLVLLAVVLFMLAFAGSAKAQEAPADPPDATTETSQSTNAGQSDTTNTVSRSETTVTEQTSTSVSVGTADRQTLPAQGQPGRSASAAANSMSQVTALSGRWRLAATDGSGNCNITLKSDVWQSGHRANVPAGCPDEFFDVTRWDIAGNEMLLSNSFGKLIATFRQATPDRFAGIRASDGAGMSLTR